MQLDCSAGLSAAVARRHGQRPRLLRFRRDQRRGGGWFHSSFVTEHHFTNIGQVSATLTLLTFSQLVQRAFASAQRSSSAMAQPRYSLAEQVATLIFYSRGRLDLGVGKATATTSSRLRDAAR